MMVKVLLWLSELMNVDFYTQFFITLKILIT